MKSLNWSTVNRTAVMILLLLSCLSGAREAQAQKLKAEEIIAKNLEAIGGTETLQSISSRVSTGTAMVSFQGAGNGSTRRTCGACVRRTKAHDGDGFRQCNKLSP